MLWAKQGLLRCIVKLGHSQSDASLDFFLCGYSYIYRIYRVVFVLRLRFGPALAPGRVIQRACSLSEQGSFVMAAGWVQGKVLDNAEGTRTQHASRPNLSTGCPERAPKLFQPRPDPSREQVQRGTEVSTGSYLQPELYPFAAPRFPPRRGRALDFLSLSVVFVYL